MPDKDEQIKVLRAALRGLLEAPYGSSNEAVDRRAHARAEAHSVYCVTAREDVQQAVIEHCRSRFQGDPKNYVEAIEQYGRHTLVYVESTMGVI